MTEAGGDDDQSELPELLIILLRMLAPNRKRHRNPVQDATIARLPLLLSLRALESDRTDCEHSLTAHEQHPGYLSRDVDGTRIYAPFPLATLFPNAATLRQLMRLADDVSVNRQGCICVSGSGVWLGGLDEVGDLDYCEYVFEGGTLSESVRHQAARQHAEVALAKVKCTGEPIVHPWIDLDSRLSAFVSAGPPSAENEVRRLKLDYCAIAERFGPLPASNIVLWLDPTQPETGNAHGSFAHQEAVIDRGQGLVRTLINYQRLAAYLSFLMCEISQHLEQKPFKALKRALSLCGTLGLSAKFRPMLDLLNNPMLIHATRQGRLNEVEELVTCIDPAESEAFAARITRERTALGRNQIPEDALAAVEDVVRTFVQDVRAEVIQLISQADGE